MYNQEEHVEQLRVGSMESKLTPCVDLVWGAFPVTTKAKALCSTLPPRHRVMSPSIMETFASKFGIDFPDDPSKFTSPQTNYQALLWSHLL